MTEAAGDGFVEYLLEQGRMNERDALALERARAAGWPDPPVNPCAEIHLPDGPRISPTGRTLPDVPPQMHSVSRVGGQTVWRDFQDGVDGGGTHQYLGSFRDWREYMRTGEINMRRDAWDSFKQAFRLAWYATRDTVAAWIFIWTQGKVNLGARIYANNAVDLNDTGKPHKPQPYQHAMAQGTGVRALDIKYDRPWWRRFIARDFG